MKKKSYDIDPDFASGATEEERAAAAEARAEEQRESRKQSRLAKASFAWTVISMLYAIISGAVLISGHWILAPYSYIMAALLGVYVLLFVVLVCWYTDDVKKGRKKIKVFKKLFGMFKVFTTLVFLIATAVSMVGVVEGRGTGLIEWLVLGANMLVAAVQLSLKIALFIIGIVAKRVGKKYTVKVQTYINGVGKDNKAKSAVMSKLYGTEVTRGTEGADAAAARAEKKPTEPKPQKLKIEKERVREIAARTAEKLTQGRPLQKPDKKEPAADAEPTVAPGSGNGKRGQGSDKKTK